MIYLYKNLINSFFKLIYGKITKLKNIKHSNELKIYHIKYNQYKLKLYAIKKGRVFTDCNTNVAYITNNKIINGISYQQNKHKIADIDYNSTLISGTNKFKKTYEGIVFSMIQGSSGTNYYHWLIDILPKVEILKKNNLINKIDYFYVPNMNNYILNTLKVYGVNKDQIINSMDYKHIQADEILVFEHFYFKKGIIQSQFNNIPLSQEDVLSTINSVFDNNSLDFESSMENTIEWDSMNHMFVMQALKEKLNVQIKFLLIDQIPNFHILKFKIREK